MLHKTESKQKPLNAILNNSISGNIYSNTWISVDKISENDPAFKESAFVVEWQMQNKNFASPE